MGVHVPPACMLAAPSAGSGPAQASAVPLREQEPTGEPGEPGSGGSADLRLPAVNNYETLAALLEAAPSAAPADSAAVATTQAALRYSTLNKELVQAAQQAAEPASTDAPPSGLYLMVQAGACEVDQAAKRLTNTRSAFTTVAALGAPLMTGKWYWEMVVEQPCLMQFGVAAAGSTYNAMRGEGVGDTRYSWSWCGSRNVLFHGTDHEARSWGRSESWRRGDVVGIALDLCRKSGRGRMTVYHNGSNLGCAFNNVSPFDSDGAPQPLHPAVSVTQGRSQSMRWRWDREELQYCPPDYRPLAEAVPGPEAAPCLALWGGKAVADDMGLLGNRAGELLTWHADVAVDEAPGVLGRVWFRGDVPRAPASKAALAADLEVSALLRSSGKEKLSASVSPPETTRRACTEGKGSGWAISITHDLRVVLELAYSNKEGRNFPSWRPDTVRFASKPGVIALGAWCGITLTWRCGQFQLLVNGETALSGRVVPQRLPGCAGSTVLGVGGASSSGAAPSRKAASECQGMAALRVGSDPSEGSPAPSSCGSVLPLRINVPTAARGSSVVTPAFVLRTARSAASPAAAGAATAGREPEPDSVAEEPPIPAHEAGVMCFRVASVRAWCYAMNSKDREVLASRLSAHKLIPLEGKAGVRQRHRSVSRGAHAVKSSASELSGAGMSAAVRLGLSADSSAAATLSSDQPEDARLSENLVGCWLFAEGGGAFSTSAPGVPALQFDGAAGWSTLSQAALPTADAEQLAAQTLERVANAVEAKLAARLATLNAPNSKAGPTAAEQSSWPLTAKALRLHPGLGGAHTAKLAKPNASMAAGDLVLPLLSGLCHVAEQYDQALLGALAGDAQSALSPPRFHAGVHSVDWRAFAAMQRALVACAQQLAAFDISAPEHAPAALQCAAAAAGVLRLLRQNLLITRLVADAAGTATEGSAASMFAMHGPLGLAGSALPGPVRAALVAALLSLAHVAASRVQDMPAEFSEFSDVAVLRGSAAPQGWAQQQWHAASQLSYLRDVAACTLLGEWELLLPAPNARLAMLAALLGEASEAPSSELAPALTHADCLVTDWHAWPRHAVAALAGPGQPALAAAGLAVFGRPSPLHLRGSSLLHAVNVANWQRGKRTAAADGDEPRAPDNSTAALTAPAACVSPQGSAVGFAVLPYCCALPGGGGLSVLQSLRALLPQPHASGASGSAAASISTTASPAQAPRSTPAKLPSALFNTSSLFGQASSLAQQWDAPASFEQQFGSSREGAAALLPHSGVSQFASAMGGTAPANNAAGVFASVRPTICACPGVLPAHARVSATPVSMLTAQPFPFTLAEPAAQPAAQSAAAVAELPNLTGREPASLANEVSNAFAMGTGCISTESGVSTAEVFPNMVGTGVAVGATPVQPGQHVAWDLHLSSFGHAEDVELWIGMVPAASAEGAARSAASSMHGICLRWQRPPALVRAGSVDEDLHFSNGALFDGLTDCESMFTWVINREDTLWGGYATLLQDELPLDLGKVPANVMSTLATALAGGAEALAAPAAGQPTLPQHAWDARAALLRPRTQAMSVQAASKSAAQHTGRYPLLAGLNEQAAGQLWPAVLVRVRKPCEELDLCLELSEFVQYLPGLVPAAPGRSANAPAFSTASAAAGASPGSAAAAPAMLALPAPSAMPWSARSLLQAAYSGEALDAHALGEALLAQTQRGTDELRQQALAPDADWATAAAACTAGSMHTACVAWRCSRFPAEHIAQPALIGQYYNAANLLGLQADLETCAVAARSTVSVAEVTAWQRRAWTAVLRGVAARWLADTGSLLHGLDTHMNQALSPCAWTAAPASPTSDATWFMVQLWGHLLWAGRQPAPALAPQLAWQATAPAPDAGSASTCSQPEQFVLGECAGLAYTQACRFSSSAARATHIAAAMRSHWLLGTASGLISMGFDGDALLSETRRVHNLLSSATGGARCKDKPAASASSAGSHSSGTASRNAARKRQRGRAAAATAAAAAAPARSSTAASAGSGGAPTIPLLQGGSVLSFAMLREAVLASEAVHDLSGSDVKSMLQAHVDRRMEQLHVLAAGLPAEHTELMAVMVRAVLQGVRAWLEQVAGQIEQLNAACAAAGTMPDTATAAAAVQRAVVEAQAALHAPVILQCAVPLLANLVLWTGKLAPALQAALQDEQGVAATLAAAQRVFNQLSQTWPRAVACCTTGGAAFRKQPACKAGANAGSGSSSSAACAAKQASAPAAASKPARKQASPALAFISTPYNVMLPLLQVLTALACSGPAVSADAERSAQRALLRAARGALSRANKIPCTDEAADEERISESVLTLMRSGVQAGVARELGAPAFVVVGHPSAALALSVALSMAGVDLAVLIACQDRLLNAVARQVQDTPGAWLAHAAAAGHALRGTLLAMKDGRPKPAWRRAIGTRMDDAAAATAAAALLHSGALHEAASQALARTPLEAAASNAQVISSAVPKDGLLAAARVAKAVREWGYLQARADSSTSMEWPAVASMVSQRALLLAMVPAAAMLSPSDAAEHVLNAVRSSSAAGVHGVAASLCSAIAMVRSSVTIQDCAARMALLAPAPDCPAGFATTSMGFLRQAFALAAAQRALCPGSAVSHSAATSSLRQAHTLAFGAWYAGSATARTAALQSSGQSLWATVQSSASALTPDATCGSVLSAALKSVMRFSMPSRAVLAESCAAIGAQGEPEAASSAAAALTARAAVTAAASVGAVRAVTPGQQRTQVSMLPEPARAAWDAALMEAHAVVCKAVTTQLQQALGALAALPPTARAQLLGLEQPGISLVPQPTPGSALTFQLHVQLPSDSPNALPAVLAHVAGAVPAVFNTSLVLHGLAAACSAFVMLSSALGARPDVHSGAVAASVQLVRAALVPGLQQLYSLLGIVDEAAAARAAVASCEAALATQASTLSSHSGSGVIDVTPALTGIPFHLSLSLAIVGLLAALHASPSTAGSTEAHSEFTELVNMFTVLDASRASHALPSHVVQAAQARVEDAVHHAQRIHQQALGAVSS